MMILAATIACLMGNDGWLLASMMVGYNLGMTYAPLFKRTQKTFAQACREIFLDCNFELETKFGL